ncbi:hypothetical protein [Nocardia sp. R6R-6]|uniref:hypothetical protein n=1 Tax=Nocardia sp. R6R-6 TaxID=3459303 RepID=UPI00403E056E
MSSQELDRMFEEGLRNPQSWEAVHRLEPAFVATFDLTGEERNALEMPTPSKLAEHGVHPMLAMWGSVMRNPDMARAMSAGEYFADYAQDLEDQ